jgi:glucosamine 6-phosphate synthetase-like amidotransferase/phosphosugar isomerase protein
MFFSFNPKTHIFLRKTPIFRDDVCFFISQSGETADTLLALREQGLRGINGFFKETNLKIFEPIIRNKRSGE